MHRALLLPEIITIILQAEASSPTYLYTCLFINKLFSLEASRILWEGCGTDYSSWQAGHVTPTIKNLAKVITHNTQRAQFYANFIRILRFRDEGEENEFIDEARFHKELSCLQFPHLEEVSLYESGNATSMNTGEVVIYYAQPNVKFFTLRQGSKLSDSFLKTLSGSCPRLRSLTLRECTDNSVSEEGLVQFLDKSTFLDALDIRTGLDEAWSYKAFEAITKYRDLNFLCIPDIQNEWVGSLRHAGPIPAFPNLIHLYAGASDEGLECLARYAPNLKTLAIYLQNLAPSHRILSSASHFTHLKDLSVQFGPGSSISGQDLLLVVQKCPNLAELSVGENEGSRPSGSSINDSIIDSIAKNMLNMKQLTLVFDRPDLLTWQSIASFARYCKQLEMLKLSCNFTWEEAITGAQEGMFPILWALEVIFDDNNRRKEIAEGDQENINTHAARFASIAPKMTSFMTVDGNEMDEAMEAAIYDICMERY
ncbi:hypothetical protein BGZ60DRAFT_407998 [Tricladium varicosporioides]|nr:hypothetical protein BGZ60DRAFT_407998 [Hymenoscyphus varicosporioides]